MLGLEGKGFVQTLVPSPLHRPAPQRIVQGPSGSSVLIPYAAPPQRVLFCPLWLRLWWQAQSMLCLNLPLIWSRWPRASVNKCSTNKQGNGENRDEGGIVGRVVLDGWC